MARLVGASTSANAGRLARAQVAKNMTPPKPPETIRMGLKDYMIAREPYRLQEEELVPARYYAAAEPEDREILRKPFERPGYKGL